MTSTTPFPVNIIAFIVLLIWVYPSIYLAARIKSNPLVPKRYKSTVQVISLFAGPVVFLILMLIRKKKFDEQHGLYVRIYMG